MDTDGLSRADNFYPEAFGAASAQCWWEPGSAHKQASTSTSTSARGHVISTQLELPWQDEVEPTGPQEKHELRLIISGHRWVATSNMGTFWHEASDMNNEDIASFALLDTFTRWLPHWQGGILRVRTNDVCVLRGIHGDYSYSGAWNAVRSLCNQYDVQLNAKAAEPPSSGNFNARGNTRRDDKGGAGTVRRALRNPDVVDAAVKRLMASGEQESRVYRTMLSHLRV